MTASSSLLRRNAVANIVGRAFSMVLWIVATPFVLEHLGQERFGVWTLFFVLSGYVVSLDLGAGAGAARFVAVAVARGDRAEAWQVIRRSLLLGLGIGLVWGLVCLFGRGAFIHIFHVPPTFAGEARASLVVFSLVLLAFTISQVLLGTLIGFQRLDLMNLYYLLGLSVHLGLLAVLLWRGHGLVAAAAAAMAGHLTTATLAARSARSELRRLPEPRPSGFGWRDLLGYGAMVQAANFFGTAQYQCGKVMLGIVGRLTWVTQFELGYRATNALWSLSALIQSAVVPAAAHAAETGGDEGARRMYDWCCRWVIIVGAFVLGLMGTVAPSLFVLWLGRPYPEVASAARWIAAALALSTFAGPATTVARGLGTPWYEAFNFSVALVVNVLAGLVLIPRFGTTGAGIAMAFSFLVATTLLLALFHRRLGVATGPWLMRLALPRMLPAAALAALLGWLGDRWVVGTRRDALLAVLALGASYSLVFLAVTWPTGEARAALTHGRAWLARWRAGGKLASGT